MFRTYLKLALAALLVLANTDVFAARILVHLWDGAAYAVVRDMYNAGELPNLRALGALGQTTVAMPSFVSGGKARSQAGMTRDQESTLLTGVFADKHTIWGSYNLGPIPKGLTIYEKLRAFNPDIKIFHFQKKSMYEQYTYAREAADVFVTAGEDPLRQSARVRPYLRSLVQDNVADWFVTVFSREPDIAGHQNGVHTQTYRDKLKENDAALGELVAELPRDAQVWVLGDHGFGRIDEKTGACNPRGHSERSASTVATILVKRDVQEPMFMYMHQFAPIWLSSFGVR